MVPKIVLTRSGPISLNTARLVNIVKLRTAVNNARPMKNVINNAYSTARRPFNKITADNNSNFNKRVNIVNDKNINAAWPNAVVNIARPKAVLSNVKGNKGNAVKASAYLTMLMHKQDLKDKGVIDSGCSRHMKRNRSYLSDYEEINGGFVTFRGIENLIDLRVKVIRCDNGTEFKNRVMNQLCEMKGIKREFSVARTPQQNGVAERKNRTLIEAARTMLADSKLPTTFWAEAVNTACYVQNRVLVIKPHNKTPYELFLGRKPALSFMRPFGCPVTILNTIDHLGKFDGKADEGFFVRYSTNSKAFRVYNSRTRIVEENPHVQFSKNTPNIIGSGPNWIFDIDALTKSMNYKPIVTGNQSNDSTDPPFSSSSKDSPDTGFKPLGEEEKKDAEDPRNEDKDDDVNENIVYGCDDDPNMPELEEIVYSDNNEDVGAEANINNLDIHIPVSPIPTTRIHKDHPLEQIIGDIYSAPQTRRMTKSVTEQAMFSSVWTLVDLPNGKRAIGTKWVYRNKKDERGTVIKNKARFVAQGYTQEEGNVYDEMDVKSAFLYGKIEEEVYVCQPPGFEDPDFLIEFTRRDKGSTKKLLCTNFEKMMHKKFQMSSMGELTFFLGLQVKQKEDGSQDKYVTEILKKFGFSDVKTTSTPMETHKPLIKDTDGDDVDEHLYRSMIGSLMYLTYSRPNIMFTDSPFDLVAYTNSDYAGASLDRKSTIGGCQFLGCRLISWQCKKQTMVANSTTEAEYIATSNCCRQATAKAKTVNGEVQLQALVDGKKVIITETSLRRVLKLKDAEGIECLPSADFFEQLALIGYEKPSQKLTFYKAFFSPQWKFLIHTILQCLTAKTTAWNKFSSTMASVIICLATNNKFNFSKYIFESMVKNVDSSIKFLMYPRFMQVFLDKQVGDMSTHNRTYDAPYHTKKIFANMKREGKGSTMPTDPQHTPTISQPSTSQPQKKQPRRKQRKDTEDPQLSSPTKPVINDTENVASVPIHSNDLLLSGEDRLKLNELMELCTSLSQRVLALKTTKANQALEIDSLKRRVKKLEKKKGSRTHRLRRLYKVGRSARVVSSEDEGLGAQEDASKQGRKIDEIDQDAEVTLVDETQGRYGDNLMFDTGVLDNEQDMAEKEVDMAEKDVSTADPVTTAGEVVTTANVVVSTAEVTTDSTTTTIVDELTLAQTLIEIKAAKPKAVTTAATTTTTAVTRPKARGVVVQEPSEFTTTTSPSQPSQLPQAKDKGKAKMVEPEKPLKKKDQIMFDKEVAQKLQAQLDAELEEEEKLARQREEDANIAEWDNVQAMMDADYELAARLQAQEQEELTIEERSKMFVELINKRKKHFARLRTEDHDKGKHISRHGYRFGESGSPENKTEGSSKRVGEELESKNLKKRKLDENVEAEVDDDQEEA
ncbi:putative ribonuclease H-like domain-containing protein [Tanacetum coccineum]